MICRVQITIAIRAHLYESILLLHFQSHSYRSFPLTMNAPASSPSISPTKSTFACIRCSERKVRCDKQNPCNACVRHNVQCIFRPPKPSRRKREFVKDKLVDERLKRYEAILQEKGIDPNQVTGTLEVVHHRTSSRSEAPETAWTLPPQATIFKPQLLHGQRGTELVDK